jgi:predicted protein tyrosine phosphatase
MDQAHVKALFRNSHISQFPAALAPRSHTTTFLGDSPRALPRLDVDFGRMNAPIDLAITSERKAEMRFQWWATMWIRVRNAHVAESPSLFPLAHRRVHDVRFNDVVEEQSPHAITEAQAVSICEFIRANVSFSARTLVSCPGGYGRSPAVALGALCALRFTPEAALARVIQAAAHPEPNPLVVRTFDRVLRTDGRIWNVFEAWASASMWFRWRQRDLDVEPLETFRLRLRGGEQH